MRGRGDGRPGPGCHSRPSSFHKLAAPAWLRVAWQWAGAQGPPCRSPFHSHRLCGSGWGAIHLAVRLGLESCVLALLQQDEGLKQQEDGHGFTPLATAAEVRIALCAVAVV